MTNPVILSGFYNPGPVTQIQPFTYNDGITYLELLYRLKEYLVEDVIPKLDEITAGQGGILALIAEINAKLAEHDEKFVDIDAQIVAINELIQSIIDNSIQVQDPVVAGLVNSVASATRVALEQWFTRKGVITVNAVDYGVKADGVTNDTVSLQNAMNAALGFSAGVLKLPAGTIVVSDYSLPSGLTMIGAGKGVTVIKQTGNVSWVGKTQGTIGADMPLTANADKGGTVINVGDTTGLAVGDLIILSDNFSYTTTDAGYKSGEMLKITRIVSATSFEIEGRVRGSWASATGSYTTANAAVIAKISPVTGITVADLTFKGDKASTSGQFLAMYASDITFRNVEVDGSGSAGIRFDHCYKVVVENFSANDLIDDLANGHVGYGIVASGTTEDMSIIGGIVNKARHAFTTMGGGKGFPHNVNITGMNVSNCSVAGIDTHAAGEDFSIAANIITWCGSGISFRTRGTSIIANRISNIPAGHGINGAENLLKDIAVKGNHVFNVLAGHGISIGGQGSNIVVDDNAVVDSGVDGITVASSNLLVSISHNTIRNVGKSVTGRAHIRPGAAVAGNPAATTGWFITHNTLIQDAGVGSAARAIDTLANGLLGAYASLNVCSGTFTSLPFNNQNAFGYLNRQVGQAPPDITGSRGGNLALKAVIDRLATDGYVTDATTA